MGSKVKKFEKKFASFTSSKYAVAVNSGTSSLEIPLRILLDKKKTIIVPTITFMATPLSVIHAGGRVMFVDVMPENLSIDPEDLKQKITSDTAGIIIVHIGGIISPHFNEIKKICEEHDLFIIEDAAHAHGSSIDNINAGKLGITGSFSFYPTKILNTAEGGMITTDSSKIFEKSLVFREHGKSDPNFNIHTELGYNWRFSELHALLGLQQMMIVDKIILKRQRIAKKYDNALKNQDGIIMIKIPDNVNCSYYKFIIYLDKKFNRTRVKERMKREYNISLPGEVYANTCHEQPVFQKHKNFILNKDFCFPGAEFVASNQLCLPLYPSLKDNEIEYIIHSFKKILKTYK